MTARRFSKLVLWLNAAVWLGFGLGYTIVPDAFAALVGVAISRHDSFLIMADVGMMMVGIGIWYIACALRDNWTRPGLVSALLICAGMLIGRIIGIAVAGSINNVIAVYVALELLDTALILAALRFVPPTRAS